MPLHLSDDRKQRLVLDLQGFFVQEFDEDLSPFRAEQLVDHFVAALGPPLYNQGVQDARGFVIRKLDDLEGEVFAAEVF